MKLCLVAEMACRGGGADIYTEELALGLAARGHEMTLVCRGASDRVRQRCQTFIAELPDYDRWPGVWRIAPFLRWRFWPGFFRGLKLPAAEVVVFSKPECFAPLARKFPSVPLVYLPHWRIDPLGIESILPPESPWLQRRLAWGIAYRCERKALLGAATTVRFTPGNIEEMQQFYRLPATARFSLIPGGVLGPERIDDRAPPCPLRLLVLGRLVETKNVAFLLDCLASLSGGGPWLLDVVGDGPQRGALERQAAVLGLSAQVRFHGHQQDPSTFLRQAHLHLFPSRFESFGLVILEAMSHGIPTLAIRSYGGRYRNANHEVLTPAVDGLLAQDDADFRKQLGHCLACPEQLLPLGRAARETYLQRHQWPAVLDRWEELLAQLSASRSKPSGAGCGRGGRAPVGGDGC
jgi:glycosyltransferase involved in cell wall biosynthesis